jgi:hypothetical protein
MATYDEMLEELKSAYSGLLICQYADKPNAIATIKANIETLLSNMLLWKIRDCWDIDDTELCVGAQLDIIGKWVGVDRYFQGQSFGDSLHLSFVDWDEVLEPTVNQGGLRDWNVDRPEDGDLLTFDNVISVTNKLNDDDFRLLIKLKIIKNNTIMSCKNIDDSIFQLFANDVFTTWNNMRVGFLAFYDWNVTGEPTTEQAGLQNWNDLSSGGVLLNYTDIPEVMTVTYNHLPSHNAIIELAKKKNCLPVPTGCKIKLQEIA